MNRKSRSVKESTRKFQRGHDFHWLQRKRPVLQFSLPPLSSNPRTTRLEVLQSGDKVDVVKYFISSRSYGQGRVRQTASNELLFPGLSLRGVTIPWQLLTITVESKIYRHLTVKDFPTALVILDGFSLMLLVGWSN